jgi:hypothetical protein
MFIQMKSSEQITMWLGFIFDLFALSMIIILGVSFWQKCYSRPSILDKWNWKTMISIIGFFVFAFATLISAVVGN